MSNKRKLKGSNVQILMARGLSETAPGTVNIATIRHDDWCSVWSAGQSMTNCDCHPEIDVEEVR